MTSVNYGDDNVIVVLLQVSNADLLENDSHVNLILSAYGTVLYSSFLVSRGKQQEAGRKRDMQVMLALSASRQLPPRVVNVRCGDSLVDCTIDVVSSPRWCRYCRKVGHRRLDCPEAPECVHCLSKGHNHRRCPTLFEPISAESAAIHNESLYS